MEITLNVHFVEVREQKIILQGPYYWKVSLQGESLLGKERLFWLPLSGINVVKLRSIIPNFPLKYFPANSSLYKVREDELRDYQIDDINFLKRLPSVAIFNQMRTGKTPTSLVLSTKWGVQNLLIITPGILQQQWQQSVEYWLGKPSHLISPLSKSERNILYLKLLLIRNIVLIVSKETFRTDSDYFQQLRKDFPKHLNFCVIVDEAHYLRNWDSLQSRSIYSLNNVPYKVALTGTPIVNNESDIFGVLKFVDSENFISYWSFIAKFFFVKNVVFKSPSGRSLTSRVVSGFKSSYYENLLINTINRLSTSRRQKEVLSWLPLVEKHKEYLVMDQEQQQLYDQVRNSIFSLELLSNLKSISLFPPHLFRDCKTVGIKIDYLIDYCLENTNKSILIFSTRTSTFLTPLSLILKKKKIEFAMLVGETPELERNKNVNDFQSLSVKILLCNIKTAGFGLNLSQADVAIFADRSYSPADNLQAESRFIPVSKSFQQKSKLIIDLICKGTVDNKIIILLEKKKNISEILRNEPALIFSD